MWIRESESKISHISGIVFELEPIYQESDIEGALGEQRDWSLYAPYRESDIFNIPRLFDGHRFYDAHALVMKAPQFEKPYDLCVAKRDDCLHLMYIVLYRIRYHNQIIDFTYLPDKSIITHMPDYWNNKLSHKMIEKMIIKPFKQVIENILI